MYNLHKKSALENPSIVKQYLKQMLMNQPMFSKYMQPAQQKELLNDSVEIMRQLVKQKQTNPQMVFGQMTRLKLQAIESLFYDMTGQRVQEVDGNTGIILRIQ